MSDETNTTTDAAEKTSSDFDWSTITGPGGEGKSAAAPMAQNLPPTPPNTGLIAGRLPIRGDTGKAIVQLPEPIKLVHCAVVMVNSGVLSDCYKQPKNVCVPTALRGRPLNDREFEVVLDGGGDHVAKGLGWQPSGSYPGAMMETRSIEVGIPYVEVMALVGVDCGCDSDNWASDNEWGQ